MTQNLAGSLVDRVVAVQRALDAAALPHAFGGAIALGYATPEPRMTRDIDINVFVGASEARRVLQALPPELAWDEQLALQLERDGQVRVPGGLFPVDLFLTNMPFHVEAGRRVRSVPFRDVMIPVLSALDIVVFKAMFDRNKDWVDIEEVFAAEAVKLSEARAELERLVGPDDHRVTRLAAAAAAARAT